MTATISGDGTSTLINLTTSGNTVLGDASTDTLNVGNGGLVKDASGNVGIGTTSPAAKLDVFGAAGSIGLKVRGGGNTGINILDIADVGGSGPFVVNASGNVGIGTSSPATKLDVNGPIRVGSLDPLYFGGTTNYITGSNGSNYLTFITNNTERARIDSSGNLLVGTTSGSPKGLFYQSADAVGLNVRNANASNTNHVFGVSADRNTTNNTYYFIRCDVVGVAYRFQVADSGNVTNTNNSYGAISDIKLKENIIDATPKLEQLNRVRVVNYNFIGNEQKQLGVVAQELEQIFPGMVEESIDRDAEGNDLGTTTKSVKYSVFVPMLVKAIQEQQALITTLTDRITALEAKG